MTEKKWKDKRDISQRTLSEIIGALEMVVGLGVLLKAEKEYCEEFSERIKDLSIYWDERSIISKQRFVTEISNG